MAKKDLTQAITVKRNEAEPESVELIAQAILTVADAADRMQKARLSRRAIELLIHDTCKPKVGIEDIRRVLAAIPKLREYVK